MNNVGHTEISTMQLNLPLIIKYLWIHWGKGFRSTETLNPKYHTEIQIHSYVELVQLCNFANWSILSYSINTFKL
jgi:hypothetical protein